jgi:hypothetical protein
MERRIELTDETYGAMLKETTHVALQASAAYANGWYDAARGFLSDMSAVWGSNGMLRMAYVWGAALYFLPAPPDRPTTPGHQEMTELARRLYGEEPPPGAVSKLVAQGDQLGAACNALAQHVSKGDVDQVGELMADFAGDDEQAMNTLFLTLMSDAGIRLRYSRDAEAQMSYDLFMAHIHADLTDDDDGDDEGESNGGQV